MEYNEFFKIFHLEDNDGFLRTHRTTTEIPRFFAETVLRTEEHRERLPQDDSSYDKWFQGNSSPSHHWKNMAKDYNEEILAAALEADLDDANLSDLLVRFGVRSEESTINKKLLCTAIARQFKAIIDGKGHTDENIVREVYLSGNIHADFQTYVDKAVRRYSRMKLIGGDEVSLDKYFVCNTIGDVEKVFANKTKVRSGYIDDPTLDSIKGYLRKKRGDDNLHVILIGSGGCGKSLLMQHLFLQSAKEYKRTGTLPIFLELRNLTQENDLMSFIVDTVSKKDESFNAEVAHRLFLTGRSQLLLDGFDEIDPSDINSFLQKLSDFIDKYDKVQVVLTSRQNNALRGINGFARMYVWPFNSEQTDKLIDKILTQENNIEAKPTVLEYIKDGFLQKDGVFSSHPLLLTYVTMKYPAYSSFTKDHTEFYRQTYKALLSDHDDNKQPYDRVFVSVDNATQFSTVFMEFCAITYRDGVREFTPAKFGEYFRKLKSYKAFSNPNKMDVENFKHDACSTACIMYESESDVFYIDKGFQEFLFAEYYAQADEEAVLGLEKALRHVSLDKLERLDGLSMFYNATDLKFKFCVLLPYLNSVFRGSEEDAFSNFLIRCFDELIVVNVDVTTQALYYKKYEASKLYYPQEVSRPNSIILYFILALLGEDPEATMKIYTKDRIPTKEGVLLNQFPAEVTTTGYLIAQVNATSGDPNLLIDCKSTAVYDYFNQEEQRGNETFYITDEDKVLVKFGERLSIDTLDMEEGIDGYFGILQNIKSSSPKLMGVFNKIREFHKQLRKEKRRSGL